MKLCLFLHAHQPPSQFPEMVEKVCQQSYRKIFGLLKQNPKAKITLNLTASLVEQMPPDVVESIRFLLNRGQIELTGTAAFHPILPFLPEVEIQRQILLNEQTLGKYFGILPPEVRGQGLGARESKQKLKANLSPLASRLRGFFPPEMAVDEKVLGVVGKLGYNWVITEETAVDDPDPSHVVFSRGAGPPADEAGLKIVRRHRQLSLAVAFSQIRRLSDLLIQIRDLTDKDPGSYVVLAMDAETFGHHRPEQLEFLRELFENTNNKYQMTKISEMVNEAEVIGPVQIKKSTWGDSFDRWQNPQNPIHKLQWQLTNLAISSVGNHKLQILNHKQFGSWNLDFGISDPNEVEKLDLLPEQKGWLKSRLLLDRALHSDQYWWSAHNPCWHYEMVKRGARLLSDSIEALPDLEAGSRKLEARSLYEKLLTTAANLYGTGVVAC